MATLNWEETKRKVKSVTSGMQNADWEGVENGLLDIVVHIHKNHAELSESTPRNHDIVLLIQEMRHGFESMDKRFDDLIHQMDKRFESMDKRFESMDKRFESMDKRFDDLIHQMDKRFEQVDKRFEQVDKRFDMMFWMMGVGFTFFSIIITYGTFFKN